MATGNKVDFVKKNRVIIGVVLVILIVLAGSGIKNSMVASEVEKKLNEAKNGSDLPSMLLSSVKVGKVSCSGLLSTDCSFEDITIQNSKKSQTTISDVTISNIVSLSKNLEKMNKEEAFELDTQISINNVATQEESFKGGIIGVDLSSNDKKELNGDVSFKLPQFNSETTVLINGNKIEKINSEIDGDRLFDFFYETVYSNNKENLKYFNTLLGYQDKTKPVSTEDFKKHMIPFLMESYYMEQAVFGSMNNKAIANFMRQLAPLLSKGADTIYVSFDLKNLTSNDLIAPMFTRGGYDNFLEYLVSKKAVNIIVKDEPIS